MSDARDGHDSEASPEEPFAIPHHPDRHFPRGGGLEYEGGTIFVLVPAPSPPDPSLADLVESVLDAEHYTYCDWFDLPVPVYTVHDEETGDVFRVVVHDARVELHVLPFTDSPGLRGFYDRLQRVCTDCEWTIECRIQE